MVSRVVAASAGTYAAVALDARGLGRAWGGDALDGATVAMLAAPALAAGLAVWCFAARSASGAWSAVAIAAILGVGLG